MIAIMRGNLKARREFVAYCTFDGEFRLPINTTTIIGLSAAVLVVREYRCGAGSGWCGDGYIPIKPLQRPLLFSE
jgi:hypothetical protein